MTVIRSQCENDEEYLAALRDDFAAAALQGMCATMTPIEIGQRADKVLGGARISVAAYVMADAMLLEREKGR